MSEPLYPALRLRHWHDILVRHEDDGLEGRIRPAITWQWAEGAVPYMAGRMAQSVFDVLKDAGVDRWVRGLEKASDHAPAWVELSA